MTTENIYTLKFKNTHRIITEHCSLQVYYIKMAVGAKWSLGKEEPRTSCKYSTWMKCIIIPQGITLNHESTLNWF